MGAWLSRSYDALEAEVVADLRAEAREAAAAAGAAAASPPTADVPPCVRRYLETAGVLAAGDPQYM